MMSKDLTTNLMSEHRQHNSIANATNGENRIK